MHLLEELGQEWRLTGPPPGREDPPLEEEGPLIMNDARLCERTPYVPNQEGADGTGHTWSAGVRQRTVEPDRRVERSSPCQPGDTSEHHKGRDNGQHDCEQSKDGKRHRERVSVDHRTTFAAAISTVPPRSRGSMRPRSCRGGTVHGLAMESLLVLPPRGP